jgi:hypothetical protein
MLAIEYWNKRTEAYYLIVNHTVFDNRLGENMIYRY